MKVYKTLVGFPFCLIALAAEGRFFSSFLLHNSQKRIPGTDISYPLGRSFHSPCILLFPSRTGQTIPTIRPLFFFLGLLLLCSFLLFRIRLIIAERLNWPRANRMAPIRSEALKWWILGERNESIRLQTKEERKKSLSLQVDIVILLIMSIRARKHAKRDGQTGKNNNDS